jgi:preprotein translocase subunit SecG
MGFITGLLSVLAVLLSVVLMIVILLQEPKGGGLAAALGGSGMEAIGVNTGSVNRFTSGLAAAWIVCCLILSVLISPGTEIVVDEGDAPADTGGSGEDGGGGQDAPKEE